MEKSCFTFTTKNRVDAITKITRLISEGKLISVNSRRIKESTKRQSLQPIDDLYTGTIEYTIVSYKE